MMKVLSLLGLLGGGWPGQIPIGKEAPVTPLQRAGRSGRGL